MQGTSHDNNADNTSEDGQDTQSAAQAPARSRRRPGKGKMVLFSAGIVVVILAIVLPITFTLKATINSTAPTTQVQFSPDGRLLMGETLESKHTMYTAPNCPRCNPHSYDEASYTVKVWNTTNMSLLYSFPASDTTGLGNQVEFSPDGRLLATSSTRLASDPTLWRITLRESQHGTLLRTLAVDQPFVSDFAFSPNGRWLAVAANTYNFAYNGMWGRFSMIKIFDVASGALLHTIRVDSAPYWGAAFLFSPDGRTIIVVDSNSQALDFFDVASGRLRKSMALPASNSEWEGIFGFQNQGQTLIAIAYGPTRQDIDSIDLTSGHSTLSVKSPFDHNTGIIALNAAQTLFASSDMRETSGNGSALIVSLWDASTGKQVRVLETQPGSDWTTAVQPLVFSPDGRLLAGLGPDNVIRIWDVATGRLLHRLGGYLSKVHTLAFSPDSRWLVTGSGYTTFHFWTASTIRIWDVQSGMSIREL